MRYATGTNSTRGFHLWAFVWVCLCAAYQPAALADPNIQVNNHGTVDINGGSITVLHCAGGTYGTLGSGITIHPGGSGQDFFASFNTGDSIKVSFFNAATGSQSVTDCKTLPAGFPVVFDIWPGYATNPEAVVPTNYITLCVTNNSTVPQSYGTLINDVPQPNTVATIAPGENYCFTYGGTNKADIKIQAKPLVTDQAGNPVGTPKIVAHADTSDSGWWQDPPGTSPQPPKGATDNGTPAPFNTAGTNAPAIGFQTGTSDLAKEATLQTVGNVLYTTEYQGFNALNSSINAMNANINAGFGTANTRLAAITTSVASIDGKMSTLVTQGAVSTNLLGLHLLSLAVVTNQLAGIGTTLTQSKTDLDGILANTAEGNRLASNILAKYEVGYTNGVHDAGTGFSDQVTGLKASLDVSSVTNGTAAVLSDIKDLGNALKDTPTSYDHDMWKVRMPLLGVNNAPKEVNFDPHLQSWWNPLTTWSHAAWLIAATLLYLTCIYPVYERLIMSVASGAIWAIPSPEVTTLAAIGLSALLKQAIVPVVTLVMIAAIGIIPVFFTATFNGITVSAVTGIAHSVVSPATPWISTAIYIFLEFFPLGEVIGYFLSYWIFRFGATHLYIGIYAVLMAVKSYFGGK